MKTHLAEEAIRLANSGSDYQQQLENIGTLLHVMAAVMDECALEWKANLGDSDENKAVRQEISIATYTFAKYCLRKARLALDKETVAACLAEEEIGGS